ncbi:hypothetical protein SNEBB_001927 [Seison nebaliae]|nr:hypothetical protein SNEBB_001927 [Seison nebaliae]
MSQLINKLPVVAGKVATRAMPKLTRFWQLAKVELVPPKPSEFAEVGARFQKVVNAAKTQSFKNLTVKEAAVNSFVALEIAMWFFVGECIGKGGVVGYNVSRIPLPWPVNMLN